MKGMKKKTNGTERNDEYEPSFGGFIAQFDRKKAADKPAGSAGAGVITFLMIALPALYPFSRPPAVLAGALILYILVFYFFFFCLCGYRSTGRHLLPREFYLLTVLTALYFITAHLVARAPLYDGKAPISLLMPTTLFIMLISIMIGPRHGRIVAILLPLGAMITNIFTIYDFSFALISGLSVSFILDGAKKRIDMVRAGAAIACVSMVSAAAILLCGQAPPALFPPALALAALNGLASGILVLGITPLLESLLHSATAFRLIELLDLGTPLLRQLASKTPGTFNHSLVVANLAEAACKAIGAKSLLARVGAYYHDIGKIDQPEYFVENQRMGNKHDDINPRLSATVIRSHVKLGIEKGRAAGLPDEVIDIIASHHGNSLIAYFYYEAQKKEENVNMEDFCYPGHPPRTKEAAVVMLADVTEAAARTLDKPSAARLEKFINDIITKKIDSAQLSESELTFRELETIKNVFVRVLASYYHTRIEYPNQMKESAKDDE